MSIADRSDHLRVITAPDFPCTAHEAFGVEMMGVLKELSFAEPGWATDLTDGASATTDPQQQKMYGMFALMLVIMNADAIEANMRALHTPGLSVVADGRSAPVSHPVA